MTIRDCGRGICFQLMSYHGTQVTIISRPALFNEIKGAAGTKTLGKTGRFVNHHYIKLAA
jgi:hypothetical protein